MDECCTTQTSPLLLRIARTSADLMLEINNRIMDSMSRIPGTTTTTIITIAAESSLEEDVAVAEVACNRMMADVDSLSMP